MKIEFKNSALNRINTSLSYVCAKNLLNLQFKVSEFSLRVH